MKKLLLIFFIFMLTACASSKLTATDAMKAAMEAYAANYAAEYPTEQTNTARECAAAPLGVYYNEELDWYIVTCSIPNIPTVYGIVFMKDFAVSSTCTINAASQKQLETIVHDLGYK